MQTETQLAGYPKLVQPQLGEALMTAVSLVRENLADFTEYFPDSNSQGQFYPKSENVEWTTGFYTGQLWLAYEAAGAEVFKAAGEVQVNSFYDRIIRRLQHCFFL